VCDALSLKNTTAREPEEHRTRNDALCLKNTTAPEPEEHRTKYDALILRFGGIRWPRTPSLPSRAMVEWVETHCDRQMDSRDPAILLNRAGHVRHVVEPGEDVT